MMPNHDKIETPRHVSFQQAAIFCVNRNIYTLLDSSNMDTGFKSLTSYLSQLVANVKVASVLQIRDYRQAKHIEANDKS